MTLMLLYMMPFAYLLVGCLLMLAANEIVSGCLTRMEFVKGMIVWPVLFVYALEFFVSAVYKRYRG